MAHLFSFKSHLKDFLVDEQLPYALKDQGEYLLVHIEKQHTTTMEIVDHISKYLKVAKSAIGYAGLKDKFGITKQWFSFHTEIIAKRFPEKKLDKLIVGCLLKVCRVLQTGRSDKQLTTKDDFNNHFTIRLRSTKKLHVTDRAHTEFVLDRLFAQPIPNFFGEQRFGIGGRNVQQALDILAGRDKTTSGFDRQFKLQAYASHLFNLVLEKRLSKGIHPIDGDLLMIDKKIYLYEEGRLYEQQDWHRKQIFFIQADSNNKSMPFNPKTHHSVALPVLGYNSLIPSQDSNFGQYFHSFMHQHQIDPIHWKLYKDLEIYGIIRSARISPLKPSWNWEGDDIIMRFTLPAGSYASVVVDQFMHALETTPRQKKDISLDQKAGENVIENKVLPQHQEKKKAKVHRKGSSVSKVKSKL